MNNSVPEYFSLVAGTPEWAEDGAAAARQRHVLFGNETLIPVSGSGNDEAVGLHLNEDRGLFVQSTDDGDRMIVVLSEIPSEELITLAKNILRFHRVPFCNRVPRAGVE